MAVLSLSLFAGDFARNLGHWRTARSHVDGIPVPANARPCN